MAPRCVVRRGARCVVRGGATAGWPTEARRAPFLLPVSTVEGRACERPKLRCLSYGGLLRMFLDSTKVCCTWRVNVLCTWRSYGLLANRGDTRTFSVARVHRGG